MGDWLKSFFAQKNMWMLLEIIILAFAISAIWREKQLDAISLLTMLIYLKQK